MPSFSQYEIDDMISRKSYKVKRGDTLSEITDKFQQAFPSVYAMNKSSFMDKMYDANKHAFDGHKDRLLDGKELELKFMCDCRDRVRVDKSKQEYVFTNEDRLIFALDDRKLWEHFIREDRDLGEYMQQNFRNGYGSSLPKSMLLPMKGTTSFSPQKKILEEIKKNLSGKMVTTNQIAEAFYKMMGASYSSSQIQDLAVKLETESRIRRHSTNNPCQVYRDQMEQLPAKCLEEIYLKTNLSYNDKDLLKKGSYKLNIVDLNITSIKLLKEKLLQNRK